MKTFCRNLKERATEIINCVQRKCCLWQRRKKNTKKSSVAYAILMKKLMRIKTTSWSEIAIYGTPHRYQTPKEIYMVFHNSSNYNYHSIIKEFAEMFPDKFDGREENTSRCYSEMWIICWTEINRSISCKQWLI